MSRLLALDQSSKISGFAVFEDKSLIDSGFFTMPDNDDIGLRLMKIRNKIIDLIKQYNIDEVAFEDIQLQGQINNVQTYKVLAEVYGIVLELLTELNIKYQIVHSQTWKSELNIKGKTRKEQKANAQLYILNKYGKDVTQDEADAIAIGTCVLNQEKSAF